MNELGLGRLIDGFSLSIPKPKERVMLRCVLFVSFALRCGSIPPTFPTLSETVHAGLLIVKLL
jgi:hypothetical protein